MAGEQGVPVDQFCWQMWWWLYKPFFMWTVMTLSAVQ